MSINFEQIKELREETGASITDCKQALEQARGDLAQALLYLRKKTKNISQEKSDRSATEGIIDSYIHSNAKIGVLVELGCETDFVARNALFKELAHNIAMQIAATNPLYIKREDIPKSATEILIKQYHKSAKGTGKSEQIIKKIIAGKVEKYCKENSLIEQPFMKNPDITIKDLINQEALKLGENIVIRRFARFQI